MATQTEMTSFAPAILYAEDEPTTREQVSRILRSRGLTPITAEDGSAAYELFEQHRPDILITDIMMPGMNGLELARKAKKLVPDIRTILMTAFDDPANLLEAIDIGINHFIVKPVNIAKLMSTLEACISQLAIERELEMMREEKQRMQRLESIGVLAGGLAHDFNNILQVIRGYVMLARMSIDPENEACDHLAKADQGIVQAHELSSKLVVFSRGGSGQRRSIKPSPVILKALNDSHVPQSITTVYRIPEDLPACVIDPDQICSALHNIIQNSIEAMYSGGTLTVTAEHLSLPDTPGTMLPSGDCIRITITDTGCGIPPENIAKVFDPYFSTKGLGPQKGVGFGLALTHAVIMRHAGKITIESEPGKGTTVTIMLPLSSGNDAQAVPGTGL